MGERSSLTQIYPQKKSRHPTRVSRKEVQKNYHDYLNSISPNSTMPSLEEERYCYDDVRINNMIAKYMDICELTDLGTKIKKTPQKSMILALGEISKAEDFIRENKPELYDLLNIAIHTLFYSRSFHSGGGSVSSLPGTIWCSNRISWSLQDCVEFLVHELTHNLLFLDERVNQHYKDLNKIINPENYAISSILNKKRPLDKVFHSLVVAYEIISYRKEFGEKLEKKVHAPTSDIIIMMKNTIKSIDTLLLNKDLVTPRFYHLFEELKQNIDQLFDVNQYSFSA